MLDPWIIEEILRREREQKKDESARIELPLDNPSSREHMPQPVKPAEENDRGVVVIDM